MWHIKSRALRELRLEKLWSLEHLADVAKVSIRTVVDLEKKDCPVRLGTLECLAKGLGVAPRAIAYQEGPSEPTKRAQPPASPSPSAPPQETPGTTGPVPPLRAFGPGVTELPRLTRLEELVALEATLPPRPPLVTAYGEIPALTAKVYQDAFTAYLVHEGRKSYVEGKILSQRGMSREQAALCGTRSGAGARFHFVHEIAPGHEVGITTHTVTLAHTEQMQRRVNATGAAIVKVVVAPDDVAEKGGGFEFFMSKTLRPWGLEVVEMVDVEVTEDHEGDAEARQAEEDERQAALKCPTTDAP